VAGTEIVLHLAGTAKGDEVKAAHLVRAGSQAGVVQLTYRPVGTYEPLPSPRPKPLRRLGNAFGGTASRADTAAQIREETDERPSGHR
jgi:hypothetical protein